MAHKEHVIFRQWIKSVENSSLPAGLQITRKCKIWSPNRYWISSCNTCPFAHPVRAEQILWTGSPLILLKEKKIIAWLNSSTEGQNTGLHALNHAAVCPLSPGSIVVRQALILPGWIGISDLSCRRDRTQDCNLVPKTRLGMPKGTRNVAYWHCELWLQTLLLKGLQGFILPFSETATDPTTTKSTRAFPSRPTGTLYSFIPCKKKHNFRFAECRVF